MEGGVVLVLFCLFFVVVFFVVFVFVLSSVFWSVA